MTSTPASQGVRLGRSSKSCATRLAVPTGRLSTSSTEGLWRPRRGHRRSHGITGCFKRVTSVQVPLIPKPLGNHRHKVRSLSYPHNLLHWSIPCFSVRLFSRTQPTNVLPRQASRPVSPLTMWGRWVSGSGCPTRLTDDHSQDGRSGAAWCLPTAPRRIPGHTGAACQALSRDGAAEIDRVKIVGCNPPE